MHNDPVIKLEESEIPVVDHYKFLGIIYDKKLTFIPHIKYLKNKCTKAQQLLRVVAHTEWGADYKTLIKLYRSLVRSQLDYASFIYRSARRSYLKELNSIHHEGLRLVLGAFRTSPVDSMHVEAHETPLQLRSERLALQYITKLKSCPSNPAYNCIFNPRYKQHFENKIKSIKPFGLRMEPIIKESKIPLNNIHETLIPKKAPWTIKKPQVILELSELPKTKTHPTIYQNKLYNILEHHPNHLRIFTDGSKDSDKTGCAAISNNKVIRKALPKESSIFTAETCAIDLALNIISENKHKRYIILSDSLSVLLSLRNKKLEDPLIIKLLSRLDSMSNTKEILICWIPSHIGVKGNDRADSAAKSALDLTPDKYKIPYTDMKPKINRFFQIKWQQYWNYNTHNKLFLIKPTLGDWSPIARKSRKEQVIISRLRIGHTRLTHSFLLKQEQQPQCSTCQTPCTVKHFLLECRIFAPIRKRFFNANNMKDLFEKVDMDNILSFLREVGLYQKI